ncbi:fanconi anemia group J protein, partial [Trifolium pratense]
DERFCEERNRAFISKWLRRPLRVYDNFDVSLEGLKSFFENAKERYGVNTVHPTKNLDLNGDDGVQNKDGIMKFTKKKNQKLNKSRNGGDKETSVIEDNISIPISSSHSLAESRPPAQRNSNAYNFKDHINLECCNLTERPIVNGKPINNGCSISNRKKEQRNGPKVLGLWVYERKRRHERARGAENEERREK